MPQDHPSRHKGFFPRCVPFPVRLYEMLELADAVRGAAVSWLPHGRAFQIHDEREFLEVVVPMFFNQTKIRSFFRQLNLWGFKRVSKGADAGAWYNEFFLRGAPQEREKMVRIKIKSKGGKKGQRESREAPDFYSMPPLPRVVDEGSARTVVPGRRATSDVPPPEEEVRSFLRGDRTFINRDVLEAAALSSLSGRLPRRNNFSQHSSVSGTMLCREIAPDTTPAVGPFSTVSKVGWAGHKPPPPLDAPDSATFSTKNKSESGKSAEAGAGLEPLPLGVPPFSLPFPANDKGNGGLTARPVAALPPSVSPSYRMVPIQNETKGQLAATDGLEALPVGDNEVPLDEFSNYIANTIQIMDYCI